MLKSLPFSLFTQYVVSYSKFTYTLHKLIYLRESTGHMISYIKSLLCPGVMMSSSEVSEVATSGVSSTVL